MDIGTGVSTKITNSEYILYIYMYIMCMYKLYIYNMHAYNIVTIFKDIGTH
jgi:hypothetical protein